MTIDRWWMRLMVGGQIQDVANEISQQESLNATAPIAATVRVAGPGGAAPGAAASLYLVDRATGAAVPQLGGRLDERDVEVRPYRQDYILLGRLAALREVPEADIDVFTGQTDGWAIRYVLNFCGISHSADDIADMGYPLGARQRIKWLKNVTAWQFISELDRVMSCKTMEVGDGRVVRVRYTLVPNLADAVEEFSRGDLDSDLYHGGGRRVGKADDIRNAVEVRGVSYECGEDNGCRCTPYANAYADHPLLGAGRRSEPLAISSPVIQDAGIAELVATDAMHARNRPHDTIRIRCPNNPNLTICKVVAFRETADGMLLPSLAPYQITSIQRTGNRMVFEAVGGAAGAVGTLTSGIEKVCGPDLGSFPDPDPWDGSFPDPGVPGSWPGGEFPGPPYPPDIGGISVPEFPDAEFPDMPGGSLPDFPGGGGISIPHQGPVWPPPPPPPPPPPEEPLLECDDECAGLGPNAREACQIECREEVCIAECSGLAPNAREVCVAECRGRPTPDTPDAQLFELACQDWTDTLGQGDIDCPVIGDDTTIVFSGEQGSDPADDLYTAATFSPPVAELGQSFRITMVAECGGCADCNAYSPCEVELGWGTTDNAWSSPKAFGYFYSGGTFGNYTVHGFFFFGGDWYAESPDEGISVWMGGASSPWTMTWTWLDGSKTAKYRISQDGDTLWSHEEVDAFAWAGESYPGDAASVYPVIRANCGCVTLHRMTVEKW